MIKRVAIIAICLLFLSSFAYSQSGLGFKSGFGLILNSKIGYDRFRILLGGDATFDMFKHDPFLFQFALDAELSYQWYHFD